jgi:glycosyltransferase involved in cell wall biosynthesis
MPAVSVVMSVFDSESYLEAALRSILDQTGVDFEFVIVDDGSMDGSSDILAEHARQDHRIRLVRQNNQGLTRALIHGCQQARGEFIARQDSDDVSLPSRLSTLLQLIRSDENLAFVSSSAEVMGPQGETLLVHRRPANPAEAMRLLLSREAGPPGHGSVMFRRAAYERVGGYREAMYFAQDSDLWLRFAHVGGLAYSEEVLYRYRVAPESISGRLHPIKLAFAEVVTELHEARLAGREEAPILARAAQLRRAPESSANRRTTSQAQTNYFIARCLMRQGDGRALSYLYRALRSAPLNARAWACVPHAALLKFMDR